MTTEQKLANAIELLKEALYTLSDLADKAGDVSEWNEGGEYFEVSNSIREFLNRSK